MRAARLVVVLLLVLAGCGSANHAHRPAIPAPTAPSTTATTTTPAAPTARPPARPTGRPQTLSGCAAALAYLDTHMAPGWRAVCPGYADGHQAAACWDIPGLCPGYDNKVVIIAVACPASWRNEAHNTWVFYQQGFYATGPWDGYGAC